MAVKFQELRALSTSAFNRKERLVTASLRPRTAFVQSICQRVACPLIAAPSTCPRPFSRCAGLSVSRLAGLASVRSETERLYGIRSSEADFYSQSEEQATTEARQARQHRTRPITPESYRGEGVYGLQCLSFRQISDINIPLHRFWQRLKAYVEAIFD